MLNIDWASNEVVGVLIFLMPGFVAVGVFQSLISNPKPSGLDVVVRSFVFTLVAQLIAPLIFWIFDAIGYDFRPSVTWNFVIFFVVSILLGLIFAILWNNDALHKPLRYMQFTYQSSHQSVLYSAFTFHRNCYVVLHLKGERRLYGWPRDWPNRPDDQHFLIEECEWLSDDGWKPIEGVSHILVPASEVELVEFIPTTVKPRKRIKL